MNPINRKILKKANEAAIYNICLYLADKNLPTYGESLRSVIVGAESTLRKHVPADWSERDKYRLRICNNAFIGNTALADSKIGDYMHSSRGSTACSFIKPDGEVFIVFRGTGSGEWIDNGEGLSGIPKKNTYIVYGENGTAESKFTIPIDYATDGQVEALNWFNKIASVNGWDKNTRIIISGHSKGGNKAQFVTMHSDLVDHCFSFDGQGFSPEALAEFEEQYGDNFTDRRRKIWSFAADNDYVNVLGNRLAPEDQICYFESSVGLHYMEAILDSYGRFRSLKNQGKLSRYIEEVSAELMSIRPFFRKYAALGVMNIFQQYLGDGTALDEDAVSIEETIVGIGVAVGALIRNLR